MLRPSFCASQPSLTSEKSPSAALYSTRRTFWGVTCTTSDESTYADLPLVVVRRGTFRRASVGAEARRPSVAGSTRVTSSALSIRKTYVSSRVETTMWVSTLRKVRAGCRTQDVHSRIRKAGPDWPCVRHVCEPLNRCFLLEIRARSDHLQRAAVSSSGASNDLGLNEPDLIAAPRRDNR